MAIQHYTPYPAAQDWVTYEEAVSWLAESGYPVTKAQVAQWRRDEDMPTRRRGRKTEVPISNVLLTHAEKVDLGELEFVP